MLRRSQNNTFSRDLIPRDVFKSYEDFTPLFTIVNVTKNEISRTTLFIPSTCCPVSSINPSLLGPNIMLRTLLWNTFNQILPHLQFCDGIQLQLESRVPF
jgi:hypothetical protein